MDLTVSNVSPVEGVDDVVFTCDSSSSDSGLTYAWYHNDKLIHNETGDTYTLSGGSRTNSGNYTCNVTTSKPLVKRSPERTVTFLCKYH